MSDRQSKFDIREHGGWAEFKVTLKFAGFVVITFLAWFFYGALVRRSYRKAVRDNSPYYVDRMPLGKNDG